MGDEGVKKLNRVKAKGDFNAIEAGRGMPSVVSQHLKKMQSQSQPAAAPPPNTITNSSSHPDAKQTARRSLGSLLTGKPSPKRRSVVANSDIGKMSVMLNIDEYDFPDDDLIFADPSTDNVKLDVTALDRYNEDIRKLRKMLIEECRSFPQKGEPDEGTNRRIQGVVRSLCRSAFYSTHNAQMLAEGSVILIVWLLNKKNLTSAFKVHLMQSFAEMVWTSEELKLALYKCNGVKILIRLLIKGVVERSNQARWACYTLAMVCVGCTEIIETLQDFPQLEEVVGEIAFHAYWTNWPANFGQILQGILFGPHSVIPVEDAYQFL